MSEACEGAFDKSKLTAFLEWITNDIRKETVLELEDSRMKWEDVVEPIIHKARRYYKMKIKDSEKKHNKSEETKLISIEKTQEPLELRLQTNKFALLSEVEA